MALSTFTPTAVDANALAYIIRAAQQEALDAHNSRYASADYIYKPIVDELLALIYGALASKDYLQAYTCDATDAVGDAVQLVDALTVKKGLASRDAPVIGFIQFKGTPGAASVSNSTTCYLHSFVRKTGLSGGTPGAPCYLQDDGSFGPSVGSIKIKMGIFTSATVALLFVSPALGTGVPIFDDLDIYTRAGVALSHLNNPAAAMFAFQNFI